MEEKKAIKISLSTLFLSITVIVIIVMVCFMIKLKNEKSTQLQAQINSLNETVDNLQVKIDSISKIINSNTNTQTSTSESINVSQNNSINLKLGKYTVNEVKYDGVGISNEECGILLKENDEFEIYVGYGCWYSGNYEIKNDELVCSATKYETESGGYYSEATDVILKFRIIKNNNLELLTIDVNDLKTNIRSFEDGFTIGMTYSIK